MLSKLGNERSLDHLGCQRGGGTHTGPLPGRRGFLYRSGDRPREGFRYRYGDEGLLFSQGFTQVGSRGLLLGLDFAVVEYVVIVVVMASVAVALELDFAAAVELVVAAGLVVVAKGLVVVVARSLLLLLERKRLHRLMLRGLL